MTQLRRAIGALVATTAVAGSGLVFASEASAAPPPASWGCTKSKAAADGGTVYSTRCSSIPSGHKQQLVLNCKLFPSGVITSYTGPWVTTSRPSQLNGSVCTGHDGTVTTYGPRAG